MEMSMNSFNAVLMIFFVLFGSINIQVKDKPINVQEKQEYYIENNSNDAKTYPNIKNSAMEKKYGKEEAEKLIKDYIFKNNPNMNFKSTFKLKETTTEEIYTKMHAQTFKLTENSAMGGQDYIIKDDIVNALGSYWGGNGIIDMKVIKGDNNEYELIYYYWTGSGISRYMEGIYKGPNNILEKMIKRIP